MGYKSGSHHLKCNTIPGVTQTGVSASSDTVIRLPGIGSSHASSSFACNSTVQFCVAPSQFDVSGVQELGLGSSSLSGAIVSEASISRSVPIQVLPGSGILDSQPPPCVASSQSEVSGCQESGLGFSPLSGGYVSEAPNSCSEPLQVLPGSGFLESQLPPSTLEVGSSNPVRIAVGVGSEEGNLENILVAPVQHVEGSEISEPLFNKAPHDLCPRISDFVGDLCKTWGNSTDWMLELRDGRKIVIPLSTYRSPDSVSDQLTPEGVPNLGLVHLVNEGHIVCWDSEVEGEGVGGSVVSDLGLEGEVWNSDEELLDWNLLGDPLEVAPLAMDISVGKEFPTAEKIGGKVVVDNTKLSLWVTNRIKAFQKFVGTSLEGFEEQVTGLLLALEERRKQQMIAVDSKRKLGKVGLKGHRELKNLMSSWDEEKESERSRSVSRDRAVVVHQ